LTPVLNDLSKATQSIAEDLSELKPREKPKGGFRRLSELLGAALGATLKAITALIVLYLIISIPYQLFSSRDDVLLEHFEVPSDLEKAGYKSEVIAARLSDQMRLISSKAVRSVGNNVGAGGVTGGSKGVSTTTISGRGVTGTASAVGGISSNKPIISLPTFVHTSSKAEPDVEVPETKISVRSIVSYVFESLGMGPKRIDGEITARGGKLALNVRITEGEATRVLPPVEEDFGNVEGLLAKGAQEIYKDMKPIVLASYLYSSRPTDAEAAKELINDCIYENKDAALANMLWGIILLNEAKYDAADEKFRVARSLPDGEELDEVLMSCRARVQEYKGNFAGAKATYDEAMRRRFSLLTVTNYANFLANRSMLDEARDKYQLALSIAPDSEIAHSGLGQLFEAQGEYGKAIDEFQTAIRLNPESSLAYCNLADALVRVKRYEEAADVARKATKVEPESENAHNTLGYVLQSAGGYLQGADGFDEAIKEFKEAIRLNPYYTIGYVNYADALLGKRQYDEAAAQVREALKIDPKAAVAHNELASILIGRNEYDEGIKECHEALNPDPNFAPASINLVYALLNQKKYAEAEEESRMIVKVFGEWSDAHNTLGYVLQTTGKYDDAIREFQESARLNPFNTYAYVNWAGALMSQKKYDDAEQKAVESVRRDAASSDAHNMLGSVLRSKGRYNDALKEHGEAARINHYNVYAYTGMVDVLLIQNDYKGAVEKARLAVQYDPLSFDAQNYLGYALAGAGDHAGAEKAYAEARRLSPLNVYAYTGLVELLLKEKKIEKAIEAARMAVKQDSQSSDAYNELGWALLNHNNSEAAIAAFQTSTQLNPYNTYAWVNWSNALRIQNKCAEALQQALKASKLDPNLKDVTDEMNAVQACKEQ
jgi:tetratricopeptide (TPR) repeat protein